MTPRLSFCIAMCTYNGAAYVREQLDSIAQQRRLPDTMIIVDDCSRDETLCILREFACMAPFPVEVIANESNLGYVKNFEKAIGLATGDVIVLSDQDDIWMPQKLAGTEKVFVEHPDADLVFSDALLVDEQRRVFAYGLWESIEFDLRERRLIEMGEAFKVLLRRNVVTGATMAFRSSLTSRLLPMPEVWVHDEWIAILVAATGNIRLLSEKLIEYRQHGKNLIGARKPSFQEKIRLLFTSREGFYKELFLKTGLLRARLSEPACFPVPKTVIEELDKKLDHLAVRTKLPHSRMFRLGPVVREIVCGRYLRYSSGWKSVVRDLFEPM